MEQDSTQAVTLTSTTVEPPVKRLRRGDVREDGRIFVRYQRGQEYWTAEETLVQIRNREAKHRDKIKVLLSEKRAASPGKLRRGDVREDGMVFCCYSLTCVNGERWLTPEDFSLHRSRQAARHTRNKLKLAEKRKRTTALLECGDLRDDGMVFWKYAPGCTDGEWWLTPEEFAAKKAKTSARARERRATDPLYALKGRLRNRVSASLKSKGFKKNTKTALMLGCTYEDFKTYIESKFLPGMSWANFSGCHIDHVVPLDAADTEADVYTLNHYTNLRPMWGPDNIAKSAKLPEEHELPDNLHPKVKEIWLTAKSAST